MTSYLMLTGAQNPSLHHKEENERIKFLQTSKNGPRYSGRSNYSLMWLEESLNSSNVMYINELTHILLKIYGPIS